MTPAEEKFYCTEDGCEQEAISCYLNDDEDTVEFFCPSHAKQHGYCMGCGNFCAGIESFDFAKPAGFCDHCRNDIEESIEDEEISVELSEFEQEDFP
jgi:hypothetical protein